MYIYIYISYSGAIAVCCITMLTTLLLHDHQHYCSVMMSCEVVSTSMLAHYYDIHK